MWHMVLKLVFSQTGQTGSFAVLPVLSFQMLCWADDDIIIIIIIHFTTLHTTTIIIYYY